MPHKKTILLFFVCSISLMFPVSSHATTNCHQTITFRALTRGYSSLSHSERSKTFWITEDVDGECQWSHLIQLSIADKKVYSNDSDLLEFGEWGWLTECIKHLSLEIPQEFSESSGVWSCSTASFRIISPQPDSGLLYSFLAASREGYEQKWIEDHDLGGISIPIFEGVKGELIYHYKRGLYIGYQFSKVYYFPPEYLLIITHQPMMANGLDTMHGFLLFKVKK